MEFLDHDEHHNMVSHPENSEEFAGLAVNRGVVEPPKVNPYFHPRKRRRTMTAGEYVEGILKGDVTVLSRAVTLVVLHFSTLRVLCLRCIRRYFYDD